MFTLLNFRVVAIILFLTFILANLRHAFAKLLSLLVGCQNSYFGQFTLRVCQITISISWLSKL